MNMYKKYIQTALSGMCLLIVPFNGGLFVVSRSNSAAGLALRFDDCSRILHAQAAVGRGDSCGDRVSWGLSSVAF